jgi:hypothetical protein
MKFRVNSRELARAISPLVEVATKNCIKEFEYEGLVTLKVEDKKIIVSSYGGTASVVSSISDSNFGSINYKCEKEGTVTVKALNLNDALTTMEPGDVEIGLKKNELVATLLSDKSSKRSMPTNDKVVVPPNTGAKSKESVNIKKEVFLAGLNDVFFAPAKEEKMLTYMCMLMETFVKDGEKMARFSAGSGGRFAIKSISGKKIYEADENTHIIFPKNNLSNIKNIVSSLEGTSLLDKGMITIRTVEQDSSKSIPDQIVIEGNGITLCVFGSESFTNYPKLTNIIEHKYPNRIYSDLQGWVFAIGGVEMSRRDHTSNIHNTKVVFEPEELRFMVTPQTAHACTTPVHIGDDKDCVVTGDNIWFKCNSEYLTEMVGRAGKQGKVQFNFESQEILEDIPKDKPKQMKPILVKFPEKSNDVDSTTENFYMFFTVSTK